MDASYLPAGCLPSDLEPPRPAAGFTVTVDGPDGSGMVCTSRACTLPSANSACDFVHGKPGSTWRIAKHTVGRAALIGIGIAAAGERDPKKLVRYGLGAALAIEVFALTWAYTHRDKT